LILKVPGKRIQLKGLVFSEYFKELKFLQAEIVVSPFEISIKNVLLSPRPFIRKMVLLFDLEQKLLS